MTYTYIAIFDPTHPPPEIAARLSMVPSLQAEVEPFHRQELSSRQLLLLQGLKRPKTRQTNRQLFNQDLNQEKAEAQPEIGKSKSQNDSSRDIKEPNLWFWLPLHIWNAGVLVSHKGLRASAPHSLPIILASDAPKAHLSKYAPTKLLPCMVVL